MLFVRRQVKDESSPGGPQYFIQGDTGILRKLSVLSKEWGVTIVSPQGPYPSGLKLVTLESGSVKKDRLHNQQGAYDAIDKQVIEKFKLRVKPSDIWKIFFEIKSIDRGSRTLTVQPVQLELVDGTTPSLWGSSNKLKVSLEMDPENAVPDAEEPPSKVLATVSRIIRDTPKSKLLKKLYGDTCQVCKRPLLLPNKGRYSETHHLRPLGGDHKGMDNWSNMIVLCPNHHAMFDRGALALLPEGHDLVVIDGTGRSTKTLSKLLIKPPHAIDPRSVDYHISKLYEGP